MRTASRLAAGAIALALAPLALAGPATAGDLKTDAISFDGFCDGLTLEMPSVGLGDKGTIDGNQNGCESAPLLGTAVHGANKKYGVTKGTEYVTLPAYGILTVVRNDHTFTMYTVSGSEIFAALDGTWSEGAAAATADGAGSSISAALAVAAAPNARGDRLAGTKDIKLSGECYGMTLTQPSAGIGEKGTVDGALTGCKSGVVIGGYGRIMGKVNTYALQYADGGTTVHTLVFKHKTWITYSLDGNEIVILDRGTWSFA